MVHSESTPKVFLLPWEMRHRLEELIGIAGAEGAVLADDLVAVKMHFGEKGNDGYIKPDLVRPAIKFVKGRKAKAFLTDTSTIYRGHRTNAIDHLALAAEHGFSQARLGVPVIIADGLRGDDYREVGIEGHHFKDVKIAGGILKADSILALTHFKGHMLTGFGGSIKNLGMGCSARLGKFEMHSGVAPSVDVDLCTACGECIKRCGHGALKLVGGKIRLDVARCAGCGECIVACDYKALNLEWTKGAAEVQERCVEYALGAVKGKRALFVNFLNHMTPNCDCLSRGETPLLDDIGILASRDPLAIDQASFDLVRARAGDVFARAHPGIDCTIQLAHAKKLGLGSREYELVKI